MNDKFLEHKLFKTYIIYFSLLFFTCGTFIQSISYDSFDPILFSIIFLIKGYVILKIFDFSKLEQSFFYFYLSLSLFFSGIAAIYINQLEVDNFNTPDAGNFYRWSAVHDWVGYYSLFDTLDHDSKNFTEGGLAIYFWRMFYDFYYFIGFEKNHFIGIYINNLLVALAGITALRTVALVYEDNFQKKKLFILFFSFASIHLIYATIHLRDSFIVLFISILLYFWINFIKNLNFKNFLYVLIISVLFSISFMFLRTEYTYLPVVFLFIYTLSTFFSSNIFKNMTPNKYILAIFSLSFVLIIFSVYVPGIYSAIIKAYTNYNEVIFEFFPKGTSLAAMFIVDIPIYLRAFIGPIYLLLYPIPFWDGFITNNSFSFLTSLNTLFMFYWTPILFTAIYMIIFDDSFKKTELYFCSLIFIIFMIGVSLTSIDPRHLGNFLFIGIIFSLIFSDLKPKHKIIYYLIISIWFFGISIIHLLWFVLKMI